MTDAEDNLTVEWRPVPSYHFRQMKTQCEEELLDKLGSARERVTVHPVIRLQPLQRAQTCGVIEYCPVRLTERVLRLPPTTVTYGPWNVQSEASRQLLQHSRRGPRQVYFSRGRQPVSSRTKEEVRELWTAQKRKALDDQNDRLETVLSTWRALHSRSRLDGDRASRRSHTAAQNCLPQLLSADNSQNAEQTPTKLKPESEEAITVAEEVDYLMQKMSYWRRLRQASTKLNKYARNVTKMLEFPKTEVRIYICSTPDLVEEREMLSSLTQPEVERVCDKYGIACHFVDLRLGVNRLAGDAEAVRVMRHEIDKSRKMSLGTAFIALLGSELDSYLTPLQIPAGVFETLREVVLREDLDGLELLDEYYRLDTNNIPPVYNLQINEQEGDSGDVVGKETVVEQLSCVIERTITLALSRQQIDTAAVERMMSSVTQIELETGLLHLPNPERNALCLMINKYTTTLPEINPKSIIKRKTVCVETVKDTVSDFFFENCPQNFIQVAHPENKDKDYLRSLHETISGQIVRLLERAIKEMDFDIRDHVGDTSEQLHHINMSSTLYHSFLCRQDLVTKFRLGLQGQFDLSKPVVVTGKRGVGKSTFMAKLARLFPDWTNNNCKIIVRFLGSSPESSNLFSTLLTLCQQVSAMFGLASLKTEEQFSTRRLTTGWWKRIREIGDSVSSSQPLVILLDSLDVLLDGNGDSEESMILPDTLPTGIILVVSKGYQQSQKISGNHFVISSLVEEDVLGICKKELQVNSRRITEDQFVELKKNLSEEDSGVLLKILLSNVREWPSTFLPESDGKPSGSHEEAPNPATKPVGSAKHFNKLFEQLEDMLEASFTKYCLSYLALSRYGISEKELVDNLIRNESFVTESMAERGGNKSFLKGLPLQLKVSKLLLRVEEFTMDSRQDGQTVVMIKVPEFTTQVITRYFSDAPLFSVHRDLGMYFMLQSRDFALSGRTTSASQVFKLHKLNLRMLRCVPYHLCRSHSEQSPAGDIVKTQLFCNMHWFLNRALSGPIHEILLDFEDALRTFDDKELELFSEVIRSSRDALVHDPFHIFVILVDTLSNVPAGYSSLGSMAKQARECLKRTDVAQLLPRHKGYLNLGTILKTSYDSYGIVKGIAGNGRFAVIQAKNECVAILDLHTGDEMLHLSEFGDPFVQVDLNGQVFLCSEEHLLQWDCNRRTVLQRMELNCSAPIQVQKAARDDFVILSEKRLLNISLKEKQMSPIILLGSQPIAMQLSSDVGKCYTLHEDPCPTFYVTDLLTMEIIKKISFMYMGKALTRKPIFVTDDGRYVVICFQYRVNVIDASTYEVLFNIGKENKCLVFSTMTRCNEHVVLADTLCSISIWALRSGEEVCSFEISVPDGGQTSDVAGRRITDIVISEDDHFLCVGLSSGQCAILHVPTQCQVLVIQATLSGIHSLFFVTDEKYFQHLLTCSTEGVIKLWNLQHILTESRQAAFPFILDDDLLNEEKTKLTKSEYYPIYATKCADKTFLNGADVTVFFEKPSPGTFDFIGKSISTPDSKFKWAASKRLGDCRNVHVCATGDVKPYLATLIVGVGVALWDMTSGSLHKILTNGKDTDSICSLKFLANEKFVTGTHSLSGKVVNRAYKITIWDTDTGEVCLEKDRLLHSAFVIFPPQIMILQNTTRETHVKLTCIGLLNKPQKLWTAQVKLTPDLVTSSELLCDAEASVLVRRRDRSFEIRVVNVDASSTDVGVADPTWDDRGGVDTTLTPRQDNLSRSSSVRVSRCPFPSIYVGLRGDQLVIITHNGEIMTLSLTSGSVLRKFKLGGELSTEAHLFDFDIQAKVKENKCAYDRRLRVFLADDGSFSVLAAGNTAELWSLTSRHQICQFSVTPGKLTAAAISGDSSTVVTGTSLGSVQVWRADTGAMVCSFPALTRVDQVFVDRTGQVVVALVEEADERRVLVLDVKSPRQLLAE